MTYIPGGKAFKFRAQGPAPLLLPYELDSSTPEIIKKGHPVTFSGTTGGYVRFPAVVSGYIEETAILGFSNVDQLTGATQPQGPEFAVMPIIKRNSREIINVAVADQRTIFTMAVCSGQSADTDHVRKTCALKWDATNKQVSLDPSITAVRALAYLIGVWPGDEGVSEGKMDFIIKKANSLFAP